MWVIIFFIIIIAIAFITYTMIVASDMNETDEDRMYEDLEQTKFIKEMEKKHGKNK